MVEASSALGAFPVTVWPALLRCGGTGMLEVATWALDQIAVANSSNATTTRRLAGSSAASSSCPRRTLWTNACPQ
jgi:hypothetical protein